MSKNSENYHGENHTSHHQHYGNHLRQDFDDDTDSTAISSNQTVRTETSERPPQKDLRILRCFCGCSQMTYEQIETYSMMNAKGIINNDEAKKLLKTFLKIGHRTDKSNALILVECCEFCDRILSDLNSHQDFLDDLIDVCPTYFWEQKINEACDADTRDGVNQQLEQVLNALKKECLGNIECDHDFVRFRRALLKKIGK